MTTLPAVRGDLFGSLGENARINQPEFELVAGVWEGEICCRDDNRVTEDEMDKVVPMGSRDKTLHPKEVSASGNSDRGVMSPLNVEIVNLGNGFCQYQKLPRSYERGRWTLVRHTRSRPPLRRATVFWNRSAFNGGVSHLWCIEPQYIIWAFVWSPTHAG